MTTAWALAVLLAAAGCATKVTCYCMGGGGVRSARIVVRPGLSENTFTQDALESCREVCTPGMAR